MQNILSQVIERILSAQIEIEPFPHFVLDNVFLDQTYRDILDHLPNDAEFISPDPFRFGLNLNAQQLVRLKPENRAFWQRTCDWLLSEEFTNAVASKFYLKLRFSDNPDTVLKSAASLGRSKSGFLLGPHTDMPHRVLTLVFYLPENDQNWEAGTSLYVPRDGSFTCSGGPHYGFENFQKVATARFLPNAVVGFMKSETSFHGVEPWNEPGFIRNSLQYEIHDSDRSRYYG